MTALIVTGMCWRRVLDQHHRGSVPRRTHWPRAAAVAVLLAASPLLSGCTAVEDGAAGLTVDEQGNLVGVIHSCHRTILGAQIWWSESVEPYTSHSIGDWETADGGRNANIRLTDDPGTGWHATQTTLPMDASHVYTFAGSFQDANASTRFVTFRVEDLSILKPGRILSDHIVGGNDELQLTTYADFVKTAC